MPPSSAGQYGHGIHDSACSCELRYPLNGNELALFCVGSTTKDDNTVVPIPGPRQYAQAQFEESIQAQKGSLLERPQHPRRQSAGTNHNTHVAIDFADLVNGLDLLVIHCMSDNHVR